ncbi:MAG: MCE family protein [Mycobacteriales bacterium]|nr:MCE family protein [Mycobacteriales bacterium]
MITTSSRLRLGAFLVLAAGAATVVGSQYVGLDQRLWNKPYIVTLTMPHSGGIFENAEVTQRGQAVGRVRALRLLPDGMAVDLAIENGRRIPADVTAVISNRSAIGEQFVDLQPDSAEPPFLQDGSVIPAERTQVPPRLEEVLLEVQRLTRSVDQPSLQTLVSELGTAFGGTGPELQAILDRTQSLTATLTAVLPETRTLLRDGRTVLQTQRDTSDALLSYSADLKALTGTVAGSDADVRRLLTEAEKTLPAVDQLLADNDQQLPLLMQDLVTVGDIVQARLPGVRTFLVAFPRLIQNTFNVVQGDGYVHFNLILDYSSGVCTSKGYADTVKSPQAKPVPELGNPDKRANLNGYCAEEPGSRTAVRGSQNVDKLPGDTYDAARQKVDNPRRGRPGPDAVPPQSYEKDSSAAPSAGAGPRAQPASYDAGTRVVSTAAGPVAVMGGDGGQQARFGSEAWKWLLLAPMLPAGAPA